MRVELHGSIEENNNSAAVAEIQLALPKGWGGRRKKRKGKREKERRERGEDSKLRFRAHAMLRFLMTSSCHLDTLIGQMPLQWGKAQEHVFPVV